MNDLPTETPQREVRPIERAKSVSQSLTDAARRARFSSRSKEAFFGRSSARRRASTKLINRILFALLVIVPNALGITYYGFVASDQYQSEGRFTVSSGAIPKMDELGSATGVPPVLIMQDTMIVVNYIESQAMVEKLQDKIGLRTMFSAESIDPLSRFNPKQPIEKLTTYWQRHAAATVAYPSGVVTLRVQAFNPQDAKRTAEAVMAECETMVNSLNDRMYKDTVAASEADLADAEQALRTTRLNYEQARNEAGIVDVKVETTSLYTLLTTLQGQLLKAQSDYSSRAAYMSPQAPQLRLIKEKIASLTNQVSDLQNKITAAQQGAGDNGALSQKLSRFANLDLQQKIAEKRYAEASAALNMARILSERQMLYLHPIVQPELAEQSAYPHRRINMGLILLGSLLTWWLTITLVAKLRQRFA